MSKPDDFRRYARRCTEIAQHLTSDEAETLSAMAQTWAKLAEDEERIADLIRDADRAFAAPQPAVLDGVRSSRRAFWDSDRRFH
jgi:hypothetical protein